MTNLDERKPHKLPSKEDWIKFFDYKKRVHRMLDQATGNIGALFKE